MSNPEVTILLPVYNGEKYLKEAIDSILAQTFTNFEVIIIDDNSNDRSRAITASCQDPRLRTINNEQRAGLTQSLNQGLRMARGRYIARMDADDIAAPERLEKEVRFLDDHPDIAVVGSAISLINDTGEEIGSYTYPQTSGQIRWCMLFFNPVAHPTVMMRKDVINQVGGYNEKIWYVEDYELWCRMTPIAKFWNLKDKLVYHRMHKGKVSIIHAIDQANFTDEVARRYIASITSEQVDTESIRTIREGRQGDREDLPLLLYRLGKAILRDKGMTHFDARLIRRAAAIKVLYRYNFIRNRNQLKVIRSAFELSPAYSAITLAYDILYMIKKIRI
jgi:glycosyltransferase involved in cell wall biosynthesis